MQIKHDDNLDQGVLRQKNMGYWNARKHFLYYKALFQYVSVVGYDAKSIIDVGSASTEYLKWMSWIPDRALLDFKIPKKIDGIRAIETDFFRFAVKEKFDVALCCQVLEHVDRPNLFCENLKNICKRLIITVPYKWLGSSPGHIQDPVDEEKLYSWMKIRPNHFQVIHEPFREGRLLAYYDLVHGPSSRFEKNFILDAIAERSHFMKS